MTSSPILPTLTATALSIYIRPFPIPFGSHQAPYCPPSQPMHYLYIRPFPIPLG
jgi:hypothetical protein